MALWSMDDWQYIERQVVDDPKGRRWSVALMDVLGQAGDPDLPNEWLELQFASGRYFTLIYSATGALQREDGYAALADASAAYERLVAAVASGRLDPAQPLFSDTEE